MKKFKKKCFEESGVLVNLRTLFRGFRRMLCGAAIAAIGGFGVSICTWVPGASGYLAVLYFLASMGLLAVTGYLLWLIGGGKKRTGAYEK